MFRYAAVLHDNEKTIIVPCSATDDVEVWGDGKTFPGLEAAVYFNTDEKLKFDQELIAVAFESFEAGKLEEHLLINKHFTSARLAMDWVNAETLRISKVPFDYGLRLDQMWMDDFEIGTWTFCVTVITGRVAYDPRYNPTHVKFASGGIEYKIKVDLDASGFNDYYENHIQPWLEDCASMKDEILYENDVIKREVLPPMVKLLIKSGTMNGFDQAFGLKYNTAIHQILQENYKSFVLA